MKKITFIVHCWLDVEDLLGVSQQKFMDKVRSAKWTNKRLELFKTYTLPSLLNQSFQDFRIFLFCGNRYRHVTEKYPLDSKVERFFDCGKAVYSSGELNSDYVNITRIDSDDMFRYDMMETVRELVRMKDRRTCLVFHNVIQWNIYHQFITDFHLPRSPFCSHTFPKSIYKNWNELKKQQFMDYASCTREHLDRKVCIVRHLNNVTWTRNGRQADSAMFRVNELKRENPIEDLDRMAEVLKDFGVRKELVYESRF